MAMPPPIVAVGLPFLNEMVALFAVSVAIAYLCYRLRLVPIAGFLLAGVLIGPTALGLVHDQELVDMLAEIGVILLLFTIGIEFSLEKLARIGRAIFVGGGLQVALSIGAVTGLLLAFGVSWQAGIYTGCLVALSSTAIVLGLLAERSETDTLTGQLALAVLIFQDLAIVAMVLVVPMLAGTGGTTLDLLGVLGRAVLLIGGVLVLARRVVPWMLEHVAHTRRQELFLLTVVAICFGTAALSAVAGVSLALGAFLAGLVVSESHYSEQALSEILPLRTIFNAVFFVSVGMLLDVGFLLANPLAVLAAAGGALLIKLVTTSVSLLVLGYPIRIAATVGLTLAQIGEFSFVLERAGRAAGLSPMGMGEAGAQIFIAATVLLMLLTPFQMQAAPSLGGLLAQTPLRRMGEEGMASEPPKAERLEDHVVIVGYGPTGRHLAAVLRETGIPFVVVDMNPASVKQIRREGLPALYGDASRAPILEAAGVLRAKLCVIAINEPRAVPRVIQQARMINPTLHIIARTRFLGEVDHLRRVGADVVVPEEVETTVRLFSHVLGAYVVPRPEIERHVRALRAHDYRLVRNDRPEPEADGDEMEEAHGMVLEGLSDEGLHTRTVTVRGSTHAEGRTLEELAMQRTYGLSLLAVRRDGETIGRPPGDFEVRAGDRLVMVGSADRFAACGDLFRTPQDGA